MKNKKILIVCTTDSMIWNFLIPHINRLNEMGNEVDCACSKTGFYFDELINKYNLNVYEFPFCRSPFRIRNITAYRKLKKFIKNGSYDVIYCHEPVGGALGRLAGKANGKYTFYIAHGFHFFKGAGIKHWTLYYFFEWFLSFFTDTIVTICDEDYNHSLKLHAKNKYKIDGIGVDFKRFDLIDKELIRNNLRRQIGINNDDFLIISVGELSKRKNHIVILKALNKLNNPNIKLVLCGEGDEKRKLEKYCKRNDLEKNVLFLGFRKDVNEILTCGDLFIFPSLWEGLGLAGIEAMYSGLPIIASNRQGIKDYVIDGKTGFLFEPKNYSNLSTLIKKIYEDLSLREKISKSGKEFVKKYDLCYSLKQIEDIFLNLIE